MKTDTRPVLPWRIPTRTWSTMTRRRLASAETAGDKKRTGKSRRALAREKRQARESGRTSAARSARACTFGDKQVLAQRRVLPPRQAAGPPGTLPSSPPEKTSAPTASCAATWALIPRSPTLRKTSSSPRSLRKLAELKERNAPRGSTRAFSSCRSPSPRVVPSARTMRSTSSAAGSK